jgi:BA14K-like protein
MLNSVRTLAATAMLAAGIASLASGASAMPIAHGLALQNAAPANVETVQWRGRGWGGRGWGGAGAGFVAGAIIGGAIAAPYYYGPGPYYGPAYYGPGPYGPPPAAYYGPGPGPGYGPGFGGPGGGDPVAYCSQRFKSYDPGSGTYLGFDGQRHPCP